MPQICGACHCSGARGHRLTALAVEASFKYRVFVAPPLEHFVQIAQSQEPAGVAKQRASARSMELCGKRILISDLIVAVCMLRVAVFRTPFHM